MPDKDANKIFCDNLRNLLKEKGMLRSELAEKIGVSKSTISMWMSGCSSPRMDLLDKIADVFGVSVAYLMTGVYSEPSFYAYEQITTLNEGILIEKYRSLNEKGKEKAIDQIELLTKIPEYRKDEQPNSQKVYLHAAHEDNPTPEQKAAADRIMQDDSEWE